MSLLRHRHEVSEVSKVDLSSLSEILIDRFGRSIEIIDQYTVVDLLRRSTPGMTTAARQLAVAEELACMGSWVLDLESRTALWSEGMYRILGLPPGRHAHSAGEILELVHPEDRERMEQLIEEVTAHPDAIPERGIEHEVRMLRADGSVRELRAVGKIDRDEAGSACWLGSAQDITELRSSERELRAHYSVSQALREWESFDLGVVDLLRRIATALDYPMASLWLWDESAGELACRAFCSAPDVDPGDFEAAKRGVTFRIGKGKPGLAWLTREPVVTPDVASDAVFRPRDAAMARGISSAVAFPAVGPAGSVAVLSFYSFEPRVPSAELLRTLTAIGRELGRFLSRRQAELSPRPLTEREIEVLRLAADGFSGPGIAEQLVLSPHTVRAHFEHVYEKLGVGDRAAAVAHALRTGLIH
jgi:PAS domain S-box-containing protein